MEMEKDIIGVKIQEGFYEGAVVDGLPHGKGKLTFENQCGYYEGEFERGLFHGRGFLEMPLFLCLEGVFYKQNFIKGKAIYYSPEFACAGLEVGAVYEGNFEDFLIVGSGKLTRPNGEVYEGEFQNAKPHGKGRLIRPDGSVKEVTYTDGIEDYEYTDEDYESYGGDERFN